MSGAPNVPQQSNSQGGGGNAALVASEQARNKLLGEMVLALQKLATQTALGNYTPATTVALLPAAGTVAAGLRSFVTDANATTFHSVVAGGGANKVPVVFDGTNWLIG